MSSNYEPLIPAVVAFNERGLPMSTGFGDIYHPDSGVLAQARQVFMAGNRLPERWQGRDSFTVCETGFGLGHNFLAVWQAWRNDPQRPARLHVLSFELHPFTAKDLGMLLLARLPESERRLAALLVSAWPPLLPGLHRLEFEGGALTLTLAFGPVERLARQVSARVDAFFLDGFAPRVNPGMWSRPVFGQLARIAKPGATAATWCCAGQMRRALRDAGFLVSKAPGFGGKREMTVATLRPGMGHVGNLGTSGRTIIVGGGLAAAGVAQALALRGHEVEVFDPVFMHGPGASHQGHIAAALSPVISRDDDPRARLSRAGVLRALQRWQSLPEPARPLSCGTLERARDARHATERKAALDSLRFPLDWVRWMDPPEASAATGLDLDAGGLWFSQGQRVRPEALLRALYSLPGVYCTAQSVSSLRYESGVWAACDDAGRVLASGNHVVLANAWHAAAMLAQVSGMPDLPKTGSMIRLAGQVSYFAQPDLARLSSIVGGDGYCLPALDGRCVGGSTYVAEAEVAAVTQRGHQDIANKLAILLNTSLARLGPLPGLADGWAGWRAAVSDHLPVIGPVNGMPGLWLACAYGSRGLTWSPLAGDLIAAWLCNEPLPLERELLRKIAPR